MRNTRTVNHHTLKKFHIHTSDSLPEIGTLAEDIANIIGVGVVRTELLTTYQFNFKILFLDRMNRMNRIDTINHIDINM